MKRISILILSVLVVVIALYNYCIFKESLLRDKLAMSHNMLYITMLNALANKKDGRKIIETMITVALKAEIEYIGENNHSNKEHNILLICDVWTQNTVQLIQQKTKEYNLSKINSNFIKGTNIITDICKKTP